VLGGVVDEERDARLGDTSRDPASHLCREESRRIARCGAGQVASERERDEVVLVAEEDSAVVVVDQQPQLVRDRETDLLDVVEPRELPREALEHLQVGDRANVAAQALLRRSLLLALVERHDQAVPTRLGGHHRRLRTGDELTRVRGVLGAESDARGHGEPADGVGLELRELLPDSLGQRGRAAEVGGRQDHRELLAPDTADDVARPDRGAQDVRDLDQQLVADAMAVHVVHLLEVVQVEHQDGDRVVSGRGRHERLAQPVVEGPVVVEARQRVGLGLVLEARPDVRVVDRERGSVAEALREEELLVGERGVLADPVDVERAFQLTACDERHGDEGLGLVGRPRDQSHPWIEVRPVREHGLAVVDGPAGYALAEREGLAHDLVLPLASRQDRAKLALRLVRLVDVHVLVGDEHGERVRDPLENRIEALLGEHVVEDLGKTPVRLGRARGDEAHLRPRRRLDGGRVGHAARGSSDGPGIGLIAPSAKIRPRWGRPTHGARSSRA
jgi:hypothetical protein